VMDEDNAEDDEGPPAVVDENADEVEDEDEEEEEEEENARGDEDGKYLRKDDNALEFEWTRWVREEGEE
jgi:hypothetical protein